MRKLIVLLVLLGVAILIPDLINREQNVIYKPAITPTENTPTITSTPTTTIAPSPTITQAAQNSVQQNLRIQGGNDDEFELDN